MLVRCEPDLADRSDPIVFPVFGRGRALLPLIGAGITEKNIQDAAAFLVGPCSCQVKELNPGFDLLLSADWDSLLSTNGQQLTAIQTRSLPLPTSREAELVPIPSGSRPAEVASHDSPAAAPSASGGSWLLTGGILAAMGLSSSIVVNSGCVACRAIQASRKPIYPIAGTSWSRLWMPHTAQLAARESPASETPCPANQTSAVSPPAARPRR